MAWKPRQNQSFRLIQSVDHSGEIEKNDQLEIESVYFSGWRSKACLHPAQQK
jgi:hypothetical protein